MAVRYVRSAAARPIHLFSTRRSERRFSAAPARSIVLCVVDVSDQQLNAFRTKRPSGWSACSAPRSRRVVSLRASAYVTQLIPGDNAMWLAMEADSVLDGSITPEFDQRVDGVAVPAALGTDTCSADPCHLGWVAADIQVSANNEFLAANPKAAPLPVQPARGT